MNIAVKILRNEQGKPAGKLADAEIHFIAGELANTQENMIRWVMDPQAVEPGTAMPSLGLTRAEAEDVSAYLAGLR